MVDAWDIVYKGRKCDSSKYKEGNDVLRGRNVLNECLGGRNVAANIQSEYSNVGVVVALVGLLRSMLTWKSVLPLRTHTHISWFPILSLPSPSFITL